MYTVKFAYQTIVRKSPPKKVFTAIPGGIRKNRNKWRLFPTVCFHLCDMRLALLDPMRVQSQISIMRYRQSTFRGRYLAAMPLKFKGKQLVQFASKGGQILTCMREAYPHTHAKTKWQQLHTQV